MGFLFFAYLAVWTALFVYFIRISSKQKRLEQELETLQNIVKEKISRSN